MKNFITRRNPASQSGFFDPRAVLAFVLCSVGVLLATLSFTGMPLPSPKYSGALSSDRLERYMPVPDGEPDGLDRMEEEWNNRLTYPTGIFNPLWVRLAAAQDALIPRTIPLGIPLKNLNQSTSALAL